MLKRKILTIFVIAAVIIAIIIGSLIHSEFRMAFYNNDYIAFAVYALCFAIVLIPIYRKSRKRRTKGQSGRAE